MKSFIVSSLHCCDNGSNMHEECVCSMQKAGFTLVKVIVSHTQSNIQLWCSVVVCKSVCPHSLYSEWPATLSFFFWYHRVTYYAEFLPRRARGVCLVILEVRSHQWHAWYNQGRIDSQKEKRACTLVHGKIQTVC